MINKELQHLQHKSKLLHQRKTAFVCESKRTHLAKRPMSDLRVCEVMECVCVAVSEVMECVCPRVLFVCELIKRETIQHLLKVPTFRQ